MKNRRAEQEVQLRLLLKKKQVIREQHQCFSCQVDFTGATLKFPHFHQTSFLEKLTFSANELDFF